MDTPYYPAPPATGRTVSGGTAVGDVITATVTTVTVTRTVTPLFVDGSAGNLAWSINVAADRDITDITFRLQAGQERRAVTRPGRPASAILEIPAGDAAATLQFVATCPVGTVLTITEKWAQSPRPAPALVLADPDFGLPSPNGVAPPAASMALPASEADSPARRSPQVRAAQLASDSRPDLLPRCSSLL